MAYNEFVVSNYKLIIIHLYVKFTIKVWIISPNCGTIGKLNLCLSKVSEFQNFDIIAIFIL